MKLSSLPTFFAAAKKVGAAPHRGNANRPIRQQGKANQARTPTNQTAGRQKTLPSYNQPFSASKILLLTRTMSDTPSDPTST
ncbi:MAG TPA: hypothetical protein VHU21_17830, partial [Paraburkholderia sp.]|nr:hypothetical protein [Paraburkholderia sp.]